MENVLSEDLMERIAENDSFMSSFSKERLKSWLQDEEGVELLGGPFTEKELIDSIFVIMRDGI